MAQRFIEHNLQLSGRTKAELLSNSRDSGDGPQLPPLSPSLASTSCQEHAIYLGATRTIRLDGITDFDTFNHQRFIDDFSLFGAIASVAVIPETRW